MISGKQNRTVSILRCVFGHRVENAITRFRKSRAKQWLRFVEKRMAQLAAQGALIAGASLLLVNTAFAQQPTGADVVAGSAVINVGTNVMDVNAASSRTIINWDQFSIGAGNTTNFNLPDANSAILNRVTSLDIPSVINGALNSNGHVHLVNPSGIMVGATGVINTNAFVASTFDIANSDFLKGGALTFSDNGSNAAIVNNGTINTGAGGAHLIANDIANNGSITSVGGNITMSGGGSVTLSNGVNYVQPTLETLASGISPTAGLIQNTGTIRATGAATSGGEVYLVNPNGKILHDGTIAATKPTALAAGFSIDPSATPAASAVGSQGGHVQLEADDITLAKGSSIDASGTRGGGEVLIGGDWQGSGEMSQATSVTMESGAKIDASATESGNGGKIVLWSDITNADSITKAFGTLVARAGELLGDGGQIETSGATVETDGISVNAGATNGLGGLWLIDPYDYTIDATAATNIVNTLNTGTSVEVATTANNASFGSSGNSTDSGDITVASNIITGAMSGDATLTLKAARHIIVNAASGIGATQNVNTAKLNVKLWADTDNSGDGINIVSSPTIATNGGSLTFGNGDTASIGGVTTQVGGDLYVNGVTAQSFDTDGGDITVNGETILANTNGVTFSSGGGDILFSGVLNSGNQYTYVDGPDGQANSWDWARNDAKNGTAGGAALGDSYMVTITSRLENAIAGIAAGYRGAWIGAYRDTSTPNNWLWADGPEAGQHFFTQAGSGGSALSGSYSNFGANEPNGSGTGGETRGQFFGTAGQWNDLGPSTTFSASQDSVYSVLGYVRETNLSPTALTVNAGAGSVTINGGVGGSKALSSFDVTAAATIVNGDSLITTGAQNYSSTLDVASTFGLDVDGTTLTTAGALDFAATGDIDISASMVVPGAISIVGNAVVISGNLTSTATGDIYLQSNAQATTALSVSGSINKTGGDRSTLTLRSDGRLDVGAITASGAAMDVVLWSDYQNANAGGIGIAGTVNTNGGHFWAGGSSTVQGSETWNGLTVGDGGSAGNVNANWNAFDMHGDINTGGGDVLLWAAQPHSSGIDGIALNANHTISAGSGDITLIADDMSGAVLTIDTTGHFTYQPDGNAWSGVGSQFDFNGSIASDTFTGTGDAQWLKINNYSTLGGLTLGKDGNTTHIYVYNPIAINGDVNLIGNNITVGDDINNSSAVGADILLKASGDVIVAANSDLITNAGDVTFWSDSDANSNGYVSLGSGSSIATSGGNIVIGGGVDSGSDGVPDGAATGQAYLSDGGTFYSGISLYKSTFDTRSGGTLDADAGNITLNGTSTYTGGDRAVGVMLHSTKLFGDVVDVTGSVTHTGGTTTRYGISANGDATPNNTNIQAFGGITLTGNAATPADQYSIRWGTNHEMSAVDGDIAINSNGQLQYLSSQTLTLADTRSLIFNSDHDAEWRNIIAGDGGLIKQGSGTLELTRQNTYVGTTTISDGHLIIRNDAPSITTSQFTGSGKLTVESDATSFSSPLAFNASINGLSEVIIGKSTNTANIAFAEDIAASGPITVYGGTLDFAGTVAAGSNNINLVGNDLQLADTVSSTGALTIETQTSGTSIGVGTATGTLNIDNAELAKLQDGFSSITIGDTNAGDLSVGGVTALTDDMTLRAGSTSDLHVTGPISWSTDNALTLAAGHDIYVTNDIDVNGANATLNLLYGGTDGTTTPTAGRNFFIDLAGRRTIDFAETTANLKVGNETYTLIDAVSDFTGMTTTGKYALANDLSLVGSTYDKAVYDEIFTGKLDGLGHAVDGMLIENSAGGNLGLFAGLNGATVRHLGVTNFYISTNSSSTNTAYRVGGLVGNVGGAGIPVSSVTNIDGVWTTGVISTEQGSTQKYFFGGGLVGSQNGGFMNMTRSYSTANVSTDGSDSTNLATGGLVGDIGINLNTTTTHTQTNSGVVDYSITKSYATGSIVQGDHGGYYGSGGLVGVIFTSGGELSDSYSWGNVVGAGSFGGIAGFAMSGTYARNYTTQASVGAGSVGTASSYNGTTLDAATSNGTVLPAGWDSDVWSVGSRPTLNLLPTPPAPLYVKVTGGSSAYGDSLGVTYTVVDDLGSAITFGSGDYANLTGTTGTGIYTVKVGAHAKNYTASYLTGLGLTGDDAADYILNPFSTSGSYSVTARALTLALSNTGVTKVYDGTTAAPSGFTPTYTVGNFVSGDTAAAITHTSALFNDSGVLDANKLTVGGLSLSSITGTNGSLLTDYSLPSTSLDVAATITAKPIVISGILANDKIYDGTTTATVDLSGITLSGKVGSDDVSLSSLTASFADKNVGDDIAVSLSDAVFTGTDKSNYTITPQSGATADITAKSITISGITAADKVYDGTTSATVNASGITFGGIISGDDLSASGTTGAFADKNVGDDKTVTLAGTTYGGTDVGNYTFVDQSSAISDITAKSVTISGLVANDRVYDGTTTATIDHSGVAFGGMISGDNLSASGATGVFADKNVGSSKSVTISGTTYGGTDVGNYTFVDQTASMADITAKSIIISGITANDRVYDGTTAATIDLSGVAFTGMISGDDLTAADTTGVFADKNVGTAKAVTLSGTTYGGTDVGNYSFTDQTSATADITAKSIIISGLTADDRKYDGTTVATIDHSGVTFTGIISGDDLTASSTVGAFADKNVGDGKTVTLTGTVYGGSDAGNYSFTNQTTTTADISQKKLTIGGLVTNDKVYNGNIIASVDYSGITYSGLVSGDDVTLNSVEGRFGNKNVGTNRTVYLSAADTSGADEGNYQIFYNALTRAAITPKSLTISGLQAESRIYDGTTAATVDLSGVSFGGKISGDDLTIADTIGAFADKNVGTAKAVTLSGTTYGGSDVGNYTFVDQTASSADITPKSLTVSGITAYDKTYDGTTGATTDSIGLTWDGLISGDDVLVSVGGAFTDKNAGTNKTVNLTLTESGADTGNYTWTKQQTTTADILQKSITISGITANDRVYDGTTVAAVDLSGITFGGIVAGDTLTAADTIGTFANKNVGAAKAVTLSGTTYGGTDVGNYSFTDQTLTTADISAKSLTVAGITAANKVYNGTTAATVDVSGVTFTGIVTGDDFGLTSTGLFSDKNVANGKTVTLTNNFAGTDVSNYNITDQGTTIANITPKSIVISGITADDKVYDGNDIAAIDLSGITFTGIVSGDSLTASGTTGTFSDRHVADDKTVTLANTTYGGSDVGNYTITNQFSTIADITPKSIIVSGLVADNKVYDGTAAATVDLSGLVFNGQVSGDDLTAVGTIGTFSDKNVATGKAVTLSGTTYGGSDLGNYLITDQTASTADITAKSLTISGITAENKVYDGTTAAAVDISGVTFSGIVTGDDFDITSTGLFSDKNIADGKTVTLTNIVAGSDVSNYSITDQSATTADITPKSIVISGIAAADKVYDGTTASTVDSTAVLFGGMISGDDLTVSASGLFDNKNVGTGKTVTLTNVFGGTDLSNYTLTDQGTTTADVSAKSISITGITASNKVYDGTTAATVDIGGVTFNGIVSGDDLAIATTGVFTDKNVANGKTVNLTNSYTGVDVNNYAIADQATTTADITAKGLTISGITADNHIYDGTTVAPVNTDGLTLGGLVAGDQFDVASTGLFSDKNVADGKTVTLTNVFTGTDVSNYNITDQISTVADVTPKSIIISGITAADKTYDGSDAVSVDSSGVLFGGMITGDDLTITTSGIFDSKNAGTGKTVTLTNLFAGTDLSNYSVTDQPTATADIARLASVTWIGGTTGDWSDPANWAGGAIPDLANVADVIVPDGITPIFDSNVTGPVDIDSLTGGNFQIDSGILNVADDATLSDYTQNGGTFNVGGNFTFDQATVNGGVLDVTGNIGGGLFVQNDGSIGIGGDFEVPDFEQYAGMLDISGNFDVTNSFHQTTGGTINVTGDVDITQTTGDLTVYNLFGRNVDLNSITGSLHLGDINTVGDFGAMAGNGDIDQLAGKCLNIGGESTFFATGDIMLTNQCNDFVGPVNATGTNVAIVDGNGGLILGDILTTGTFDATSTDGPITQSPTGALTINGPATFTATQGGNPANIILGNLNNDFRGPVSADGHNIELFDAHGGLLLHNIMATGDFVAASSDGPITQTPGGGIEVLGMTTVAAAKDGEPADINLTNPTNNFAGIVNASGKKVDIDDADNKIQFGEFSATDKDEMLMETSRGAVRDTNTRYTTDEASSGTGILNVVQRYGQEWVTRLVQWLGGPESAPPALTEQNVQSLSGEVHIVDEEDSKLSQDPGNTVFQ